MTPTSATKKNSFIASSLDLRYVSVVELVPPVLAIGPAAVDVAVVVAAAGLPTVDDHAPEAILSNGLAFEVRRVAVDCLALDFGKTSDRVRLLMRQWFKTYPRRY